METSTIYEQIQFQTDQFVSELYPDQFLLFFLWSQGFTKKEDLDRLVITVGEITDPDDDKIYVDFRLGNDSLKTGSFAIYAKTGINTHQLTYKRLFNKRFAAQNFLQLEQLYDDVTRGNATTGQLEDLLKKQVSDNWNSFYQAHSDFISGVENNHFKKITESLNQDELEKLVAFYKQSAKSALSAGGIQSLLKNMFSIDTKVEFQSKMLKLNYHPEGIGLDDPQQKYRLGKIVLDGEVKYKDMVAGISHHMIPEIEIGFNPKVDYIFLAEQQLNEGKSPELFIPLTNSTQDNYSFFKHNGIHVQFPSCIFAYTLQLVRNQIELLYKLQNSNHYLSENLDYGKEMQLHINLYYSLDKSGNLEFADENYPGSIKAEHTVKVTVYEKDKVIRIQTEESAIIRMEECYHYHIKNGLEKKINEVLDVLFPAVYERSLNLG